MAKIYCIADIHGYFNDFEKRVEQIKSLWNESADKLVLLGDYVDRGPDSFKVLEFVHSIQLQYPNQIIALMGNHEEWLLDYIGEDEAWITPDTEDVTLLSFLSAEQFEMVRELVEAHKFPQEVNSYIRECILHDHKDLINWIKNLPLYYETEKQIFVHAGVDEDAGEYWKWGTSDEMFLSKYPAETGTFYKDIVAGHVGTDSISGDKGFHDIFWDGKNHYYCDGTVYVSKRFPVLVYDSDTDKYYSLDDNGSLKNIEKHIS